VQSFLLPVVYYPEEEENVCALPSMVLGHWEPFWERIFMSKEFLLTSSAETRNILRHSKGKEPG
jgi:hypothetical protein